MPVLNRIRAFLGQCWQSTKNLTFFSQHSTDPYEIESGRIATRIYIVLLVSFLGAFVSYYSVTDVSQTIRITAPSIDTYRSLVAKYPSLTCPCRSIDLLQSQFIQLAPVYHQVKYTFTRLWISQEP